MSSLLATSFEYHEGQTCPRHQLQVQIYISDQQKGQMQIWMSVNQECLHPSFSCTFLFSFLSLLFVCFPPLFLSLSFALQYFLFCFVVSLSPVLCGLRVYPNGCRVMRTIGRMELASLSGKKALINHQTIGKSNMETSSEGWKREHETINNNGPYMNRSPHPEV